MNVVSVRMSKEEYIALQKFSKENGVSMSKALRDAFFEMLEEKHDLEVFDKAYAEYLKDPKTYSLDEIMTK